MVGQRGDPDGPSSALILALVTLTLSLLNSIKIHLFFVYPPFTPLFQLREKKLSNMAAIAEEPFVDYYAILGVEKTASEAQSHIVLINHVHPSLRLQPFHNPQHHCTLLQIPHRKPA